MTLDPGLITARFVHDSSLLVLFGTCIFPLYTYAGGGVQSDELAAKLRISRAAAAVLALVSGIVLFGAAAASMAGAWSDLDWNTLEGVITATSFGPIWIGHILLAAVVTLLTLRGITSNSSMPWILLLSSGVLLASLAAVGHTQDGSGLMRSVHFVADGLHLLAAGAWLGGILALFYLVSASLRSSSPQAEDATIYATARFSGLGTIIVVILVGSGLVNAWVLVGTFGGLLSTGYGNVLLIKLALFAGMLLFAATNRFHIVPALLKVRATDQSTGVLIKLRRHVVGEQALGLLVILLVAALGTMEPAINAVKNYS